MGKNLDRILELAPRAKLLREEVDALRQQKRRREVLGVDSGSLDREIEARETELTGVEKEMAPLLARDGETAPPPTPPPASAPTPPPPAITDDTVPRLKPDSRGTSVLRRINAQPGRLFTIDEFVDICGSKEAAHKTLWRLAMEQHLIERVGSGPTVRFRSLDKLAPAATTTPSANGAADFKLPNPEQPSAQENVLAYMELHRGISYKAAAVTRGMGLSDEYKASVVSSLNRLVTKGALKKTGSKFCLPVTEHSDLEVTNDR